MIKWICTHEYSKACRVDSVYLYIYQPKPIPMDLTGVVEVIMKTLFFHWIVKKISFELHPTEILLRWQIFTLWKCGLFDTVKISGRDLVKLYSWANPRIIVFSFNSFHLGICIHARWYLINFKTIFSYL